MLPNWIDKKKSERFELLWKSDLPLFDMAPELTLKELVNELVAEGVTFDLHDFTIKLHSSHSQANTYT